MSLDRQADTPSYVRFRCPHCDKVNKAPVECAGLGGTCPKCGGGVQVPREGVRLDSVVRVEIPNKSGESMAQNEFRSAPAGDAELIDFTPRPAAREPQSLESLADRRDGKRSKPSRSRTTPLWMWALHIAISLSTLYVLARMYHARQQSQEGPIENVFAKPRHVSEAPKVRTPFKTSDQQPRSQASVTVKTWDEYEVIIEADGQSVYVVRHMISREPGGTSWTVDRHASPPPGFPDNVRVIDESTPALPAITTTPKETPPTAPSLGVRVNVAEGFAALRAGDQGRAVGYFGKDESAMGLAGRALASTDDKARLTLIEAALRKATTEGERRTVTLAASRIYLERNPSRAARLLSEQLNRPIPPDESCYLALGTALARIAIVDLHERPPGYVQWRTALGRYSLRFVRRENGHEVVRFGNEWRRRQDALNMRGAIEKAEGKVNGTRQRLGAAVARYNELELHWAQAKALAEHLGGDPNRVADIEGLRRQTDKKKAEVLELTSQLAIEKQQLKDLPREVWPDGIPVP